MRRRLSTELSANWSHTNVVFTDDVLLQTSAQLEFDLYAACRSQMNYSGKMAGQIKTVRDATKEHRPVMAPPPPFEDV